jgi:putative sporulation protein YtxC
LEVYFESDKEVMTFCEHLFRYNKQIELHWKTHKDWGNHIQFKYEPSHHESVNTIAKAMTDVFCAHRLSDMIEGIVRETFYFREHEEIERITELGRWICTGRDRDAERIRKNKEPGDLLHSLFMTNIKSTHAIHYDSIVRFQFSAFKDQLIYYTGLAIEEFKREEDHQDFINMLREYVADKQPDYKEIHIMQGDNFTFFTPDGKPFSRMELRKIMHAEPLYIVGLDIDEFNLSPLIAMAPAKINIYGDDPSEPKTHTVINVFQEKVHFEPINSFPFPAYLKNQ